MTKRLFEDERVCRECGEPFWGTAGAHFCSSKCRSRAWRAKTTAARGLALADVCSELLRRLQAGSASYSKLLPRLFRQSAAELRQRGWDPIELLMTLPDEPATESDTAPGGIEGSAPSRRRWLHPPKQELKLLNTRIAQREAAGRSANWHRRRRGQLLKVLEVRQ